MTRIFCLFILICSSLQVNLNADSPATETVFFTPPKDWNMADTSKLPPRVSAMVIGQSNGKIPPSINLSTEEFEGSVKDYLKIVKEINQSKGNEWKDLGSIKTQAGEASLSQADANTEWGQMRMMHVILSQDNMIYILTGASSKEEFQKYYKTFFEAFRTLSIEKNS